MRRSSRRKNFNNNLICFKDLVQSTYYLRISELANPDCPLEYVYEIALAHYLLLESNGLTKPEVIKDFMSAYSMNPKSEDSKNLGHYAREHSMLELQVRKSMKLLKEMAEIFSLISRH